MGVKISELSEAMATQNTDLLPIVQNGETKKIQVETLLKDIQTQIDSLNTTINTKNVISAGLNSNQIIATTDDTKLILNNIKAQIGNDLSLNNGSIVIGAGINYIKISAQIEIPNHTTGGLRRLLIYKNNSIYARAIKYISYNYQTIGLPSILMPVQEGDEISLYVKCDGDDTTISSDNRDTFLTIEAID